VNTASLYIRRESGGPSWQVWPCADVIPSGTVQEVFSYFFELKNSASAAIADLFVDDVKIEALRSPDATTARWRWCPGFHAGVIDVSLQIPGESVRRFEITTDPDLRKLTRIEFDSMVREILEDTFALFALSSFRKGIKADSARRPPALARLEFIRSRAEEIIATVDLIARAPRNSLQAENIILPSHRISRATGPEILKSFRSGLINFEKNVPSRLPVILGGRLPSQIVVRRGRSSVDTPEHRQIKSCLKLWSSWMYKIADVLTSKKLSDDPDLTSTSIRWAKRVRRIARSFMAITTIGFMTEVQDVPAKMQISSLFMHDPRYKRFYKLWRDMNLGLSAVFGDFLQMPLAKTYDLYELWCFIRLLRAAVIEYGDEAVALNELFIQNSSGEVTLAKGAITVHVSDTKTLCFQRQYQEYWVEPSGEGSFSRVMVPDLVFIDRPESASVGSVIILDAKYRINTGLNDALSSIHTYRDSLVRVVDEKNPEGIVTSAYLLTPYMPELLSDFYSMPLPGRLFHPQYREKFKFGAITLKPGMPDEAVQECLRTIVSDSMAS
jgi:hypothetical protein